MAKKFEDMSLAERLAMVGASFNGGTMTPEAKAYMDAINQNASQKGWSLPVAPPKPDPEAMVNQQFNRALPRTSAPSLRIDPNAAAQPDAQPSAADIKAPMPQMSDNPTDDEQSKMNKLMWLKQQRGQ